MVYGGNAGVLAIIGVLSITVVMGFNYAMNKVRANQVYNDIKLPTQQFICNQLRPMSGLWLNLIRLAVIHCICAWTEPVMILFWSKQ